MTLRPLPLIDDVDRRGRRLATVICVVVVAAAATAAFAFAEMAAGARPSRPSAPSTGFQKFILDATLPETGEQFMLEPTVPSASDVLPNAPVREDQEIATYGG